MCGGAVLVGCSPNLREGVEPDMKHAGINMIAVKKSGKIDHCAIARAWSIGMLPRISPMIALKNMIAKIPNGIIATVISLSEVFILFLKKMKIFPQHPAHSLEWELRFKEEPQPTQSVDWTSVF